MFTGIIETTGTIKKIEKKRASHRITIATKISLKSVKIGESIAVDGCCLTVVKKSAKSFIVDIARESLKITTLGSLKVGSVVNLERSLRLGDRLGGHLVQGHVDAIATLTKRTRYPEGELWSLRYPKKFRKYLVKKGSVTLTGVSLTINEVRASTFEIFLIPHTLEVTTLGKKKVKDQLNLEVDILSKTIETLIKFN